MIDPNDPLKDGLTPPDYDEYGDVPESGEQDADPAVQQKEQPEADQSPLG